MSDQTNAEVVAEARTVAKLYRGVGHRYGIEQNLELLAARLEAAEAELTRRDEAAQAARDKVASLPDDARMEAYYYGFERTGVGFIDAILSAVAIAGKASHHTEAWSDEDGYGYFASRPGLPDAVSAVDLIQKAAQQAADAVLAAAPVSLEAVKAETTEWEYGVTYVNPARPVSFSMSLDKAVESKAFYDDLIDRNPSVYREYAPSNILRRTPGVAPGPWVPVETEGDNRG